MTSQHTSQFGLMVAYVVPGFVGLSGLIPFLPIVSQWLQPVSHGEFGFAPTAYALLTNRVVEMLDQGVVPWRGVTWST